MTMEIFTLSNIKEYSEKTAKELLKALSMVKTKGKAVGDGEFEVVASTAGVDRDGEVIAIKAWDTDNFMKNPVVLFGHDYWSLPIGVVTSLESKGDQLIAKGIFAKTAAAQEIRQLYDDGILKAVSVGFIVKQRDPANPLLITEAELLELSFVPVPANADALSLSKLAKSINFFKSAETAKKDDAPAPVNMDQLVADLRADLEAAVDDFVEDMTDGGADEPEEGEPAEPEKAMKELLQNNAELWDTAEIKEKYEAIKAAYKEIGKTAPELKSYTQYEIDQLFGVKDTSKDAAQILDDFFADVKARYTAAKADIKALGVDAKESGTKEGRVLSSKNRLAIENAVKVLKDILELAEPEKGATQESLKGIKELLQSIDKLGEKAIVEVKKALE